VNHRTLLAALTFGLLVASAGIPVAVPQVAAAPNVLASNCITPQLTLAPALTQDPDRNPDGSQVKITPDQRARYTPIIMVHGWTGTDVHNNARTGNFSHKIDLSTNRLGTVDAERSMIGQLQRIPGAAVFTFDYQQFSARWVDDSHLGPALGAAIDCLYQATGEKIIIVGHSMGGLAARYAVTHRGVGGIDRATEVSTVVTFGTPETGSLIALLADGGANTAAAAGLVNGDLILPLLRLFLAECGTLATSSLQTGTICDFLPGPARAFDSDAGRALRYGSAQLAALKPWPKAIVVDALAGQTTFQVPQAGWFALPWNTAPVPVGDMIVTVASALKGTSVTKQVHCSYQLNAVRGAADSVGLTLATISKNLALVNKGEVAQQPFAAFKGACLHTDLMRDIELTNEATGEISADISSRQPVTATDLLSAPVPASCRHRAGTLVNGRLPGIPQNQGDMQLGWLGDPSSQHPGLALGDLNGDGHGDAATVLDCNAGGVPWPEIIAFYTAGPKLLGSVGLDSINLPGHSPGENDLVSKMSYSNGAVNVSWVTEQDGDAAATPTLAYSTTLRWNGRSIGYSNLIATTEVGTAQQFLADLRRGDNGAAARLAAAGVGAEAANQFGTYPNALNAEPVCRGLIDLNLPPSVQVLLDTTPSTEIPDTSRVCLLPAAADGAKYVVLGMTSTGFRQWQVEWFRVI
jgi:pimeloyl-ACP methyl ester carboxylesterase